MSTFRRRSGTLFFIGVAMLLVSSAPTQAKNSRPRITFGGLQSATTCIGGPSVHPTSYHLEWAAAKARGTGRRKIVYNVYEATTPGGENYSMPTYKTAPGVTSFDTPTLTNEDTYYFVVRARDRTGHEDSNTVEREGQNLCE